VKTIRMAHFKRTGLSSIFFLTLALVIFCRGTSVSFAQGERILSFNSHIIIQPDASLLVTETIRVRAEGQEIKRGIYRDFPQLYRGRWGLTQRTGFDVTGAQRDGQPETFRVEKRENGRRVYLGKSDVFLKAGEYNYELTYRTDRQLGFFQDHDELYWNVTGTGWVFPIDRATATVVPPANARVTAHEAYTGPMGAKGRDYESVVTPGGAVEFFATRRLAPREGLTIVVSWPKGCVKALTEREEWFVLIRDNPGIFLAAAGLFFVLGYYVVVWFLVGKDPAAGTIIPRYGPPKGFSPAAVRSLVRMGFDHKAFAANLIDLAVKGAVKIEKDGHVYTVVRKSLACPKLLPDESQLLGKLVGDRPRLRLEQTSHVTIGAAIKSLKTSLSLALEKTFFIRNFRYWLPGLLFSLVPLAISLVGDQTSPQALFLLVWLTIWTIGVTVLLSQCYSQWRGGHWGQALFLTFFSIPFVAGECFGLWALTQSTSAWVPVFFLIGAGMNGVFYHLLKAPTHAGRKILDEIEGFRMYLSVAEKDRLNFLNPPEKTPELFEMFLPYALALNVEQKWAEQFEQVLAAAGRGGREYSPSWYRGSDWHTAGMVGFTSALGSSVSSAIASSSTAPGSSSGGGGGGSSGGGGGGGGGGGW
jgi:hypothetical protein